MSRLSNFLLDGELATSILACGSARRRVVTFLFHGCYEARGMDTSAPCAWTYPWNSGSATNEPAVILFFARITVGCARDLRLLAISNRCALVLAATYVRRSP